MRDLHFAHWHSAGMTSRSLIRVQGRTLSGAELAGIQVLIDEHPEWSRHRVAKELCQQWKWRTPVGQLKTFAARSLLLKLAERHQLRLPPVLLGGLTRRVSEDWRKRHGWGLELLETFVEMDRFTGTAYFVFQPVGWALAETVARETAFECQRQQAGVQAGQGGKEREEISWVEILSEDILVAGNAVVRVETGGVGCGAQEKARTHRTHAPIAGREHAGSIVHAVTGAGLSAGPQPKWSQRLVSDANRGGILRAQWRGLKRHGRGGAAE